MTVAPDNRNPPPDQWFACPCRKVVRGVARVDYIRGLEIVGPELMCSTCLSELFERQRLGAIDFGECVSGVRVLEQVGEFNVAPA